MKGLSALGSKLVIVLAFFSLILLVIVKEKYFKNVVEKFFGAIPFSGCGGDCGGDAFRGDCSVGQDLKKQTDDSSAGLKPGISCGAELAPALWHEVDDDMSKPCTKDNQCNSNKCTEFGLCAFS